MKTHLKEFSCHRVLVIDDNEVDLFIAKKVLETAYFTEHIETLSGVDRALIRLSNGKQLPDFVFIGLQSSYKDGFAFLDELQHFPQEVRKIKIVILSLSPFSFDEERSQQYEQVVGYFQKPLSFSCLKALRNS